jgi:crossover junction endodeoxyribonuclease RuvC
MSTPYLFFGVDPGASGAIAALWTTSRGHVQGEPSLFLLSDSDDEIASRVMAEPHTHGDDNWVAKALIESVHAMPKQGVTSSFKFGASFGKVQMLFAAMEVSRDYIPPQKWQREMGCLSRGDKNVTKRRAQELFPGLKITHAVADALLLAELCRRRYWASRVADPAAIGAAQ